MSSMKIENYDQGQMSRIITDFPEASIWNCFLGIACTKEGNWYSQIIKSWLN